MDNTNMGKRCPKCGGYYTSAQIVNKVDFKQGHGCLWFLLFGIWYLLWITVKWSMKYFIFLMYMCSFAPIFYVIALVNKKQYRNPEWLTRLMQRRGRAYNRTATEFVCNQCGHHWKA